MEGARAGGQGEKAVRAGSLAAALRALLPSPEAPARMESAGGAAAPCPSPQSDDEEVGPLHVDSGREAGGGIATSWSCGERE